MYIFWEFWGSSYSAPTMPLFLFSTGHGPVIITPGVATIRRTPSKPSTRRSGSVSAGPIPIRTPVIPVKTPTPPDAPGAVNGTRGAEEMRGGMEIPDSLIFSGPNNGDILPMVSWSGQASTNPPAAPQGGGGGGGGDVIGEAEEGNMLVAIRKGVKLKRTLTNDRSAPRIAWWRARSKGQLKPATSWMFSLSCSVTVCLERLLVLILLSAVVYMQSCRSPASTKALNSSIIWGPVQKYAT